ncbi:MAG: right-handed parallel beta-helix repeat-containing protein, partial [Planctomycetota bacterium]
MWRVCGTLGRVRCVIAFVVSALAAASAAQGGDIVRVDDDALPGGDGTSWPTAYRFLQDALADAAGAGGTVNEIRVAGGVYKADRDALSPGGTGDRAATFQLLNGVAVNGGYLGLSAGEGEDPDQRDIVLFETILTGDLNDDDVILYPVQWDNAEENSFHLVSGEGVDATAVLEGFTIRQGFAVPETIGPGGIQIDDGSPSISQCTFLSNGGALGGGVRILGGQPSITGCTFINNQATEGAGLYIEGGRPTITDCAFVDNTGAGVGGGVSIREADPHFVDCLFAGNIAGLYAGAGVSNFGGNPIMDGCTFVGNDAIDFGGGFHSSGGNPVLVDCTFESNIVLDLGLGGGMAHLAPEGPALATLINCTFDDNTALALGAGLYNGGPDATSMLVGCVFRGNLAVAGGG